MPLEMIEVRNLQSFAIGFGLNVVEIHATVGPGDLTSGWCWASGVGAAQFSHWTRPAYYRLADQYVWFSQSQVRDTLSFGEAVLIMDSQGINVTGGRFRDQWGGKNPFILSFASFLIAGQTRLEAGVQKIYTYWGALSGDPRSFVAVDPITLDYTAVDQFPDFDPEISTIAVANNGYYISSNYISQPNGLPKGIIFFEGITDSAAYSEITGGAPGTSHPLGLCIIQTNDCRLGGVDIGDAFVWVDCDTGNAVGFLNIPDNARGTTDPQSEPNIDGNAFDWSALEFVPDPDSLDAQPKGELHVYSTRTPTGSFSASGQFPDGTPFTGYRIYVTVYEFNPFNLTTGTQRTHNLRTFLSAIDIPTNPGIPGGFDLDDPQHPVNSHVSYHQGSATWFVWNGHTVTNPANEGLPATSFNPQPNDWGLLRWKRAFNVIEIVQSEIGPVVTNATIRHQVIAYGDFSQRAAGVALTGTLARASTYQEQFAPGTPTTVYVVDAAVIDDNSTLRVYEGDVATGTLLTEGVDYSVVYATGTITGILFTAFAIHSLVYEHRGNELTPAHGTLLTSQSTTDENGVARFEVSYPDDATLENMIDSLTVSG